MHAGTRNATKNVARELNVADVNLVQKACCNGHYGFHGLKVSSVLQADGIRHAHSESLRRHDSVALSRSKMIEMIRELKIGDDLRTPKVSSDSAYGRNDVNQPRYTEIELSTLNDDDRMLAIEQNRQNKGPQMAVECTFNEQMRKFTHADYFVKHKIFDRGERSENKLSTLHNLQTFFFNLFICAQNHGSQVTGILGVNPPTVEEHLHSENNDMLIDLPE